MQDEIEDVVNTERESIILSDLSDSSGIASSGRGGMLNRQTFGVVQLAVENKGVKLGPGELGFLP